METFWKQFHPKDAQKLAKQRLALMASSAGGSGAGSETTDEYHCVAGRDGQVNAHVTCERCYLWGHDENNCDSGPDEEAPSETGCATANSGDANSKVKGGGTCYPGGGPVSKAMLLLLTIFTVASPTETATSSTSKPFHPPTHPVGQWRQLGVSSWGARYREQKYEEVPTAAKYDQQAMTRLREPRSLLFGRHRLYDGACVHAGLCGVNFPFMVEGNAEADAAQEKKEAMA